MTQATQNKTQYTRRISAFIAAWVIAVVIFPAPVHAGKNDGVEGLNEVQQVYAARTLQFIKDMDAKHFARAAEIDGDLVVTTRDFDYDFARYETLVGRGQAIEKIGRMNGIVFEPTGDVQSPTVFGRYYGIDVHPKNPRLGMIHAAFLVQYYPDGTSAVGGTLNVLAGAAPEEDLAAMKVALDEVFEKHGVDSTPLRKRVCEGTEMAVDKDFRRRLACVGASFLRLPDDERQRGKFPVHDRGLGHICRCVSWILSNNARMRRIPRKTLPSRTRCA